MKKKLFVVSLVFLIALGLGGVYFRINYYSPHKTPVANAVAPQPPTRAELLALVNEERAKHGVAPLIEDARLDQSAQMKADDEVKYNYFGHVSPIDGKHGYEFINQVGISCRVDTENITQNTHINDSKSAVNAWIISPPHHEAMIDPKYTLTGFGINGTQVVEHFCQV